tara:strand:- start:4152 stop:4334 length:183 start_codon:yes stop_codon:yes gene_type:complete
MAKGPKFRGSSCSKDCGGHKAGFKYATGGGGKKSPASPSFNKGMKIAVKATKARNKRKSK